MDKEEIKKEAFFYMDQFYPDIETLLEDLGWDEEYVKALPEDYVLNIKEATLEPVVELSADWILERIDDERWTEDGPEWQKVHEILDKGIDYKAINAAIPKLYYESPKKNVINKQDLLQSF